MNDTAKDTPTKVERSYEVAIDEALCDGCAICVFYCKPKVLEITSKLNRRGITPAVVVDEPACTNCGLCVIACPQLAIAVTETSASLPPNGGDA